MNKKKEEVKQTKALTINERVMSKELTTAIQAVAPVGYQVDRHLQIALRTLRVALKGKTDINTDSVITSVYEAGMMGLSFDPRKKEAYLIPFKSKDQTMVNLITGYKGLEKLCENAGMKRVVSKVIYEDDVFDFEDLDGEISYTLKPSYQRNRGAAIWVLTVAFLDDDTKDIKLLPYHKVEDVRDAQLGMIKQEWLKKKSAWYTCEEEMARKTGVRRHLGQLRQSYENENLSTIIRRDEMAAIGQSNLTNYPALKGIVSDDYEQIVNKNNNPEEERKSTKPEVTQPIVEDDEAEAECSRMVKLVNLTGKTVNEIEKEIGENFDITAIDDISDSKFSNIVDFFMA